MRRFAAPEIRSLDFAVSSHQNRMADKTRRKSAGCGFSIVTFFNWFSYPLLHQRNRLKCKTVTFRGGSTQELILKTRPFCKFYEANSFCPSRNVNRTHSILGTLATQISFASTRKFRTFANEYHTFSSFLSPPLIGRGMFREGEFSSCAGKIPPLPPHPDRLALIRKIFASLRQLSTRQNMMST